MNYFNSKDLGDKTKISKFCINESTLPNADLMMKQGPTPLCLNNRYDYSKYYNNRYTKKTLKPFVEREGDWICKNCNNLNFAFRMECNRCKLPKNQEKDNKKEKENISLKIEKKEVDKQYEKQEKINKNFKSLKEEKDSKKESKKVKEKKEKKEREQKKEVRSEEPIDQEEYYSKRNCHKKKNKNKKRSYKH